MRPIPSSSTKKVVNVMLNTTLLDEAKALGIDVSRTLEEALTEKIRIVSTQRWQAENREAIAWHNALSGHMGGTLQEVLGEEGDAV